MPGAVVGAEGEVLRFAITKLVSDRDAASSGKCVLSSVQRWRRGGYFDADARLTCLPHGCGEGDRVPAKSGGS